MGKSPTVFPYENFDDEEDAKALKAAFKGFGSDEDAIIEIITKRSNDQRRKIATRFKTMYGKLATSDCNVYYSAIIGWPLKCVQDEQRTSLCNEDRLAAIRRKYTFINELLPVEGDLSTGYSNFRGQSMSAESASSTHTISCLADCGPYAGKDLIKELKSELRGNFEDLIIALMTEPIEFQAKQLHKAISGLGTDEPTIVEILSVHNNEDVTKIANEYEGLYQTSLEADIKGDTSGTLKRLLVSLSTGNRDESDVVDRDAAFKDAQALLQAGELLFAGTDESVFNQVMCQRNIPQLRLVFEEYEKLVGHPIETAIENEFSGTIKDALLQLIQCIRDRTTYLATRLHDSMAGIGTDDRTLVRIVVSRSEIDLEEIKQAYEAKYEKNLAERIADDTSGDYKKAILAIVR